MKSGMNDTNREIEELLYLDADGKMIDPSGLDYIEPIPQRFERIKLLLKHQTNLIRLDAAVLLTQWGVEEGVDYIEDFINRDAIDEEGEYACRNNRDDCTYDVFSQCLVMFTEENPDQSHRAISLLKKILSFFGKRSFQFRINIWLERSNISIYLIDDFERAIDFCIENNKMPEASSLLPLYAKWGERKVLERTIMYMKLFITHSDPSFTTWNVIESLSYIPLDLAMSMVPFIESINDSGVKLSLKKFLKTVRKEM